jgi:hypothetical protein
MGTRQEKDQFSIPRDTPKEEGTDKWNSGTGTVELELGRQEQLSKSQARSKHQAKHWRLFKGGAKKIIELG